MGFKITLTVKHIRGHSFEVECERDADVLGIKVLIWELQNIPIEKQRLVYSGREMSDSVTLSSLEINDGDTLFLVESGPSDIPKESVEITTRTDNYEPVEIATTALPELHENVPAPHSQSYEFLDDDSASEERIDVVLKLSFWCRLYFILMVLLSLCSLFMCLWSLIPALVFILGWIGARRLNRCLLVFPIIIIFISIIFGVFGMVWIVSHHWCWGFFVLLVITTLNVMVVSSIWKLIHCLGRLTSTEYRQCRARIIKRCWCC